MQGEADIVCQECGRRNGPGSRFCDSCGNRIDGTCTNCGHQNEPEAKFCNSCGQRLYGEARRATSEQVPTSPALGASVCPRCLHRNDEGSQFCYSCGLPLTGENARASPRVVAAFQQGTPGGFWVRAVAIVIDFIVLTVLDWGIYLLLGEDFSTYSDYDAPLVFADLVILVTNLLYAPVLIGLWSTTIGKRALNLYVLRADGTRCGFGLALGRSVASILSALMLGIGYLMVAFREDKRALHDLIAGTAVIQRS